MIVVLPVKRFTAAKSRLGQSALRERLTPAMVEDVMRAVSSLDVIVVSGESSIGSLTAELGFEQIEDPDQGHVAAADRGVARAMERGADCVALIAGDCPLIDPADLRPGSAAVVVFADRHGAGTNGLILSPPDAITPAFGAGSRARHQALADAAGLRCEVREASSLAIDADTPEDIELIAAALRASPDAAPATARVLL